ncbi:50S ribosomal protein L32 [candidate division WOR-1 bacterium RIFOXYA12_FULL_43_27]|uniref:Large ribosomal subunit protein bL32 n=1 Tax=candidate division WOR-1 bacterium RIFOXYC2_FULL_46_14 TaxID=1802587 RepID=A0A1F4U5X3_UNCSA|nr:MAG: 50S ribosomal protein L32 [candidate division WOR-1 bacterium RIFOXYA12_FULL_43_27]OGC18923.1 MAG: 50S ribosomal protein L32 [candidate division WOR-1 bacterium RIFOXYB2_FULL_46_45]OGC29064.1 MAG: 50S ribosomal protein L32 [candidate division WOR-1 bacterium RIFOXYA2_FULL_46_56]OGC39683.1 MAG: 50S ribosomal protein L32 [candidate division WOR-1 bacterium RIFOXYC2_FULL_46_14]
MPQPKKRHTASRQGKRRANWLKLKTRSLRACPQCGKKVLPHAVCPSCGTYKGRQVIKIKPPKKKAKE